MKTQKLFKVLLITTAIFIVSYWTSVFTQLFPVNEIVSGYKNWFMSFPIPDFYIAICALLTVYYISKNMKLAGLFGAMTGSGLLFLGLYAVAYGHNTGLLYVLTTEELIEIGIKIYCLAAGTYFILKSWKLINQ
ncbi:MAG: hypothetical protein IPO21_03315 [Bacteroidales bacterium]|nr:hypothetical protein [Bacteroidales bacterium]